MKRASHSCCNFLCVGLAAAYLKYCRCRLSYLPFVRPFFSLWHTYIHDGAGGWVSEVFVSTDARRAYPRGVIGSTMGTYPRGTGSNPVEGNGHFFPHTVSSIFRLSMTHVHTHIHKHRYGSTHHCLVDRLECDGSRSRRIAMYRKLREVSSRVPKKRKAKSKRI